MTEFHFSARLVQQTDLPLICTFPQTEKELFFMFPRAKFPLTIDQLSRSIAERFDSTVIILEDRPVGFANFYQCTPDLYCAIGNVVVDPKFRGVGAGRFLV
jgi:hypothetical protein